MGWNNKTSKVLQTDDMSMNTELAVIKTSLNMAQNYPQNTAQNQNLSQEERARIGQGARGAVHSAYVLISQFSSITLASVENPNMK